MAKRAERTGEREAGRKERYTISFGNGVTAYSLYILRGAHRQLGAARDEKLATIIDTGWSRPPSPPPEEVLTINYNFDIQNFPGPREKYEIKFPVPVYFSRIDAPPFSFLPLLPLASLRYCDLHSFPPAVYFNYHLFILWYFASWMSILWETLVDITQLSFSQISINGYYLRHVSTTPPQKYDLILDEIVTEGFCSYIWLSSRGFF